MQLLLDSACGLYRAIDTPRSLACFMLAKYGEWDQLVSLTVDPSHYLDARSYALDCQATEFLRKCEDLPTTFNRQLNAEKNRKVRELWKQMRSS